MPKTEVDSLDIEQSKCSISGGISEGFILRDIDMSQFICEINFRYNNN